MAELIVVAMDSFKGCLTAAEACAAVAEGVRTAQPEAHVLEIPVADGGEGTAEALALQDGGRRLTLRVPGPMADPVDAAFYISADRRTAYMDTAAASGLPLVAAGHRDAMAASSYGTGLQIAAAIAMGCRKIVLGLGGSACSDCGIGILEALGYRFLDANGAPVGRGAAALPHIMSIDSTGAIDGLHRVEFTLYTDVDSPLFGPYGAAMLFGPQKGATPGECQAIDEAMQSFAKAVWQAGYNNTAYVVGAGAAGGIGFGLSAILGATLKGGSDAVLRALAFDDAIAGASLVITGEGRMDATTLHGKAPFAVAQAACRQGIPVAGIGGSIDDTQDFRGSGFDRVFAATPAEMSLSEAMQPAVARRLLAAAAKIAVG